MKAQYTFYAYGWTTTQVSRNRAERIRDVELTYSSDRIFPLLASLGALPCLC